MKTTTPILAATLSALHYAAALAQAVRITSDIACSSCAVALEPVATLDAASIIGPPAAMARDPSGGFYYLDGGEGNVVKMFDNAGRFVRRIGRKGSGPGEYERARAVVVSPDRSVNVLDGGLGRRSVFNLSGTLVRTTAFPADGPMGRDAVLLADGQFIVNTPASRPGSAGFALQRVDQKGGITRLFDEGFFDARRDYLMWRRLSVRPKGGLVVANPFSFAVDLYTADLERTMTIVRAADWLPPLLPTARPGDGVYDKPLTPRLNAAWEDANGLLWLDYTLPSPKWKPAPSFRATRRTRQERAALVARPRFVRLIEVVDPARRRVLARTDVGDKVGMAFGGGYFVSFNDDDGGEVEVRISRVQFKR